MFCQQEKDTPNLKEVQEDRVVSLSTLNQLKHHYDHS
jgi:hypothetical protein